MKFQLSAEGDFVATVYLQPFPSVAIQIDRDAHSFWHCVPPSAVGTGGRLLYSHFVLQKARTAAAKPSGHTLRVDGELYFARYQSNPIRRGKSGSRWPLTSVSPLP